MTTPTRLEEIQNLVSLFPTDPFPHYGLAMEYKTLGDREMARKTFAELLEKHPAYVPQYLMYGKLLVELGDRPEAARVLTLGIAAARTARNQHALGELQAELDGLGEGSED